MEPFVSMQHMGEWNHSSICVCDCMCSLDSSHSLSVFMSPCCSYSPQDHQEDPNISVFDTSNLHPSGKNTSDPWDYRVQIATKKDEESFTCNSRSKGGVNIQWILLPRKLLCTLKNGGSKTAKSVKMSPNCRGKFVSSQGFLWCPSSLLAGNDVVFGN